MLYAFPSNEELGDQLAFRDAFLKRYHLRLTPAERLAAMARLQNSAWERLRQSPEGYAHFIRRNFKARAVNFEPKYGS